jgi:hypothetical protein
VIGRGSGAVVYEATQIGLERRVALKLVPHDAKLDGRFRSLTWPEHVHVASMYAAGAYEHGHFVAMQLVRGATLAELSRSGRLEPAAALEILGQVAEALDAAHAAGIVHTAVRAQNVLVDRDGRAFLSDFGLGSDAVTPSADRAAFATMLRDCLGDPAPPGEPLPSSARAIVRSASRPRPQTPRRRRHGPAIAAAGAIGVVAALVVLPAGSDEQVEAPPPVLRGAQPLGSALQAAGVSSVDCDGQPPSGASQPCTLLQTELPGRPLVARRTGVIRRWIVFGAHGDLALQVLRRRGDRFTSPARTAVEHVPDGGIHAFPADLPIRRGDRIGVEVTPGSAIGVRMRVRGAATGRWFGPLLLTVRPIERGPGSGFDHEILLRAEYVPGGKRKLPGRLTGRAAAQAPAGRELRRRDLDLPGGEVRAVAVVRLPGRIALDLFAGEQRLARLTVPDADAHGRLRDLNAFSSPRLTLRWRNPDGRTIEHDYAVRAGSIAPLS